MLSPRSDVEARDVTVEGEDHVVDVCALAVGDLGGRDRFVTMLTEDNCLVPDGGLDAGEIESRVLERDATNGHALPANKHVQPSSFPGLAVAVRATEGDDARG